MAQSIVLGSDIFLDSSGVTIDSVGTTLQEHFADTTHSYNNSVDTTYIGSTHQLNVYSCKWGKAIRLNMIVLSTLPTGMYTTICTLNSEDRPHTSAVLSIEITSLGDLIRVNVDAATGVVQLYPEKTLTGNGWLRCVLPIF